MDQDELRKAAAGTMSGLAPKAKAFFLANANYFSIPFLILVLFFSTAAVGIPQDLADQAFERYDTYWSAAQNDVGELDAYYGAYAYASPYTSLADRAAAARAYALRAKEAFAEWAAFRTFVNDNSATLKAYGTDANRLITLTDAAKAQALSNAKVVSSELAKLAGTNANKTATVAGAISALDALK